MEVGRHRERPKVPSQPPSGASGRQPARGRSWVTRALESRSRRAMAARDATAPLSSWRSHSAARSAPLGRSGLSARLRCLLAAAKSTTTHDAKFLLEELLGSKFAGPFG